MTNFLPTSSNLGSLPITIKHLYKLTQLFTRELKHNEPNSSAYSANTIAVLLFVADSKCHDSSKLKNLVVSKTKPFLKNGQGLNLSLNYTGKKVIPRTILQKSGILKGLNNKPYVDLKPQNQTTQSGATIDIHFLAKLKSKGNSDPMDTVAQECLHRPYEKSNFIKGSATYVYGFNGTWEAANNGFYYNQTAKSINKPPLTEISKIAAECVRSLNAASLKLPVSKNKFLEPLGALVKLGVKSPALLLHQQNTDNDTEPLESITHSSTYFITADELSTSLQDSSAHLTSKCYGGLKKRCNSGTRIMRLLSTKMLKHKQQPQLQFAKLLKWKLDRHK